MTITEMTNDNGFQFKCMLVSEISLSNINLHLNLEPFCSNFKISLVKCKAPKF